MVPRQPLQSTGVRRGLLCPFHSGMFILSIKEINNYSESKLYDTVHEINNLYPLDSYKIRKNILKTVSSNINKIVTSRLEGRTRGNCRMSLSGPQFLRTPSKNPQGIHRYQNPFEKWIPKPV